MFAFHKHILSLLEMFTLEWSHFQYERNDLGEQCGTDPVFIPENFKGGPVAPLTFKTGGHFQKSGGHFDPPKSSIVNFVKSFSNMFDEYHQ